MLWDLCHSTPSQSKKQTNLHPGFVFLISILIVFLGFALNIHLAVSLDQLTVTWKQRTVKKNHVLALGRLENLENRVVLVMCPQLTFGVPLDPEGPAFA